MLTIHSEGKRKRVRFQSFQAALDYKEELLESAKEFGERKMFLSQEELSDYRTARALVPTDTTLTEVVMEWMRRDSRQIKGVKFSEALKKHWKRLEDRNLSTGTYRGYKHWYESSLAEFGDRESSEDLSGEIEKWFVNFIQSGEYAWHTVKRGHAFLSGFYKWAIREKLTTENWIKYVELPKEPKHNKVFLTADETDRLLRTAQKKDPGIINYLALGLFAGIRPEEIRGNVDHPALAWDKIDFQAKSISIESAKDVRHNNSTSRYVEGLPKILWAWLTNYSKYGIDTLNHRTRVHTLFEHAGIKRRMNSLFRKTFATHMVPIQGITQTALQMGHTNTHTLQKHYKGVVPQAEGSKYTQILP